MAAFSNWLEAEIVDHFLRGQPSTPPANVYLALFSTNPGEDASGTEVAYANYARQAAVWTALDGNGQTTNSNVITFPANGEVAASVTVTHAAIFNQESHTPTKGIMLLYGALAAPKTLAPGDVLSFAAGALTLSID